MQREPPSQEIVKIIQTKLQMNAPPPHFPGLTWSQVMRQIAHRSFNLKNRLLGRGLARDWWGIQWWLYSVCVQGLMWSMLQQSESLAACSAQCRTVRHTSGLWQTLVVGWRPGENEIAASAQSRRGMLRTGREYQVDLQNDPLWFTLMLCSPDSWEQKCI